MVFLGNSLSVAYPEYPRQGICFRKLHEIEKKIGPRGGPSVPYLSDPPMFAASHYPRVNITKKKAFQ